MRGGLNHLRRRLQLLHLQRQLLRLLPALAAEARVEAAGTRVAQLSCSAGPDPDTWHDD
jgi:hypothetical protein